MFSVTLLCLLDKGCFAICPRSTVELSTKENETARDESHISPFRSPLPPVPVLSLSFCPTRYVSRKHHHCMIHLTSYELFRVRGDTDATSSGSKTNPSPHLSTTRLSLADPIQSPTALSHGGSSAISPRPAPESPGSAILVCHIQYMPCTVGVVHAVTLLLQ